MGQKLSVDHSNDLTQGKSSAPPLILQPSPEVPAPVNLPTSPTFMVPGGKNGKGRALPRPPSLLLRPEHPDREAAPPPGRSPRITKILDRGSLLPNPWDTDSRPQRVACEREFYRLPASLGFSVCTLRKCHQGRASPDPARPSNLRVARSKTARGNATCRGSAAFWA